MTTVRSFVAATLLAALASPTSLGCSKDKSSGGDKPAADATAVVKVADAAAPTPADAAPSAETDASAATAPDAAAGGDTGDAGKTGDTGKPGDDNDDKPKNIKLLPRTWSTARIKQVMKGFNGALGVKCTHCHDVKNYADDGNKHKVIARKMISMTQAMDKQFFKGKGKLRCATCHNGEKKPK